MSQRSSEDRGHEAHARRSATSGAVQRPSPYDMPEAENILRRVIEIIESSPGLPMSASVRVNKDEVLELLDEAVSRLPDEVRSARWLLKDREEFLAVKQREADQLLADASARAGQLVQRQEIVSQAEARSQQIVADSKADARRRRLEADDYCDQKLASFENAIAKLQKTVGGARKKLAAPTIEEAELGEKAQRPKREAAARRTPASTRTGEIPVFDQDQ